jgi:hypothetical protein
VYNALGGRSSAADGVAVGDSAGLVNNGEQVTFIGSGSGLASTGIKNTFLGADSGSAFTTGTRNTILGRYNGNDNSLDLRTVSKNLVLSDGDGVPLLSYQSGSDRFALRGSAGGLNQIGIQGSISLVNGATLSVTTNTGANLIHVYDTGSGSGAIFFANYAGATSILVQNGGVVFGIAASGSGEELNLYKNTNSHPVTLQNYSGATRALQIQVIGCSNSR